jgi:hypothetical protein
MAFLRRFLAGVELALLAGCLASAAPPEVSADQVKAIFLYKLVRFVEWPEAGTGVSRRLTICVVSADSFADLLDAVVKSNPQHDLDIEVRRMSSAAGARSCSIVYFGQGERRRLRAELEELAGAPILTAGAAEGFATQGCVLDFWVEANRIRFAVNLDAASRGRLKMSSQLLSLAAEVVHK